MLHKVVQIIEFVGKILKFDKSNEDFLIFLFCGAACHAVQGSSYLLSLTMGHVQSVTIPIKLLSNTNVLF